MIRIICVCGARPNFMKIAPLIRVFKESGNFHTLLVHTGQHYDEKMSKLFFDELHIPKPDINLEVGSGSHAVQTAEVMKRFEPIVLDFKPDYVLVVGDVNGTIACGLVAVKLGVKLIHVEAGLRSFDRTMPEEINRILTDSISDLFFVTEQSGVDNLKNEGVNSDKVHLVGNVMIDTLLSNKEKAEKSDILEKMGLKKKGFAVITLHRPSNVDDMTNLEKIISAFEVIQKDLKLIFPIHPRTKKNIEDSTLQARVNAMNNLILLEPVGYLDFLCLTSNAALVMTDSGGIQEETTILGVPCMTLRENTERPITLTEGTNRLVHITTEDILKNYHEIKSAGFNTKGRTPPLWDGKASERIVRVVEMKREEVMQKNIQKIDEAKIIRTAREINDFKPHWVIKKVKAKAERFKNPVIGCLGLAFKANIDDLRESPALEITRELIACEVGRVMACEPNVINGFDEFPLYKLEDVLKEADILLVLVDHDEFKSIDRELLKEKVIIDTRGICR